MSFDLYFVERRDGETWSDVMTRLEQTSEAGGALTEEDSAIWQRIVGEVGPILDGMAVHDGSDSFELDHETTGMQLTYFPGEIAINVPYWHEGDDAATVERMLRDVASAVERATGLTAYDPQADAAFLATQSGSAAATFDRVAERMSELGVGGAEPGPAPRPWWKRLLGRR